MSLGRLWCKYFENTSGSSSFEESSTEDEPDSCDDRQWWAPGFSSIQEAVGLFSDTLELLRGNENYFRNEFANIPKIVNGPKGNKTSKTAASVEMLNGIENPTVLDYSRNFGNAAKYGLNRTTHWAVYYFTNPNSWYPVLERAVILSAIRAIQPLPPLKVTVQSVQKMSDWA